MKAIVFDNYGSPDRLRLEDIPKPTPDDNEVLVKVYASSVNTGNLAHVEGKPFVARLWTGLRQPNDNIPGSDIAGRVELIGRNVRQFQPGDEVYGDSSDCGFGAYAEYVAVPESVLAKKPANLTFPEAATVPQAGSVALQALRDSGKIRSGQKVLIIGASGGNGTFAVQVAKFYGAEVTAVCGPHGANLVRSIGADHVIDYTREDFTQNGQQYDLILVNAGYRPILQYRRALAPNGIYISSVGNLSATFQALLLGPIISMFGSKKMMSLYVSSTLQDLDFLKELIEAGKVKPVIDRCYPLSETADALTYYAAGHAKGKVAIAIDSGGK